MSWNHTIRNKLKPVVKVWRAILCIVASLAQTSLGSETFSDGQVQMLITSAARRGRLKGDDATMPSATVHHNTLSPQNSACPMVVRALHAISVTSTSRVPYSSIRTYSPAPALPNSYQCLVVITSAPSSQDEDAPFTRGVMQNSGNLKVHLGITIYHTLRRPSIIYLHWFRIS